MFLENKYTKWYYKILAYPDNSGYIEKHHIIPKCMGGSNNLTNLVKLSARQHFVCHLLLPKMTNDIYYKRKLRLALSYMMTKSKFTPDRYIPKNSRLFEKCKSAARGIPKSKETRMKMSKSKKGVKLGSPSLEARANMSKAQKGKTISNETKQKISKTQKGRKTAFYGKTHSDKSLLLMSLAQQSRIRLPAPKHKPEAIENNRNAQLKFIYTLKSPDGTIFRVINIKQFCHENCLSLGPFNNGLTNIGKTFKDDKRLKNKQMIGWTYISRTLR